MKKKYYDGTWQRVKDENVKLRLWEEDYESIAGKLIHDFGLRGEKSIQAIRGGWVWEAFPKRFRKTFLQTLRELGVTFEVVIVKKKLAILMLGTDRVKVASGIKQQARARKITNEQKWDYLMRLGKGEFPNPQDEFEVALEFELLLSS